MSVHIPHSSNMTFGKITWMNSMRDLGVILSLVSTVYNIVLDLK